jgi:hypothetical protein
MTRGSRRRRIKSACTAAWVLTVALWVLSITRTLSYSRYTWRVELGWGSAVLVLAPENCPMTARGFACEEAFTLGLERMRWWQLLATIWAGPAPRTRICVPLLIPLVVLTVVTTHLWFRDYRRFQPGHCRKCGYNLTGNVSGRCPECGEQMRASDTET